MTGGHEIGQVGIFWAVPDGDSLQLVTEATELRQAEWYGDFLIHPNGHYETWAAWRALSPWALKQRGFPIAIAWREYEHFPRGRVVFHVPERRFTVYADRHLHEPTMWERIVAVFALPAGRTRLLTDPHYRTGQFPGRLQEDAL